MMKKIATTSAALALIAGVAVSATPQEAEALTYYRGHGPAVVGGFVAGAIVGSALAAPRYVAPAPVYVAPAPVYYRPAPWTPEWYQYCSAKYRSFNPNTGYYFAFSGKHRFCR